jgi:hypothetical protein
MIGLILRGVVDFADHFAARWLDEVIQGATIDPGEVRKLVIAIDLKQGNRVFTLFNP